MEKKIKRISTKILKMNENNQYGQAITKALLLRLHKKTEKCPYPYRI